MTTWRAFYNAARAQAHDPYLIERWAGEMDEPFDPDDQDALGRVGPFAAWSHAWVYVSLLDPPYMVAAPRHPQSEARWA